MRAGVVSRYTRGLRAAAGAVLAASCAIAHAELLPLPASALISRPELKFTLDQQQSGTRQLANVLYERPDGHRTKVAAIETSQGKGGTRVAIRSFASAELSVATLERLYTLALRLDPEAGFCFSERPVTCDAGQARHSHGEVLRQIKRAREDALATVGVRAAPWGSVSMARVPGASRDADLVSVRLTSAGVPLADVRIFFNQAPHCACVAKTDADGVANCRLVDQHGDEDEHAGEVRAVVATFPGDVKVEPVLPPTTFIVRAGRP